MMSLVSFLTFLSSKKPDFISYLFIKKFKDATETLGDLEYGAVLVMLESGWYVDLINMMSVNKAFHEWFLSDIKPVMAILEIQEWFRYRKIHRDHNLGDSRNFPFLTEEKKRIAAWRLCLRDSRNVFHCSPEILNSFTIYQWLVLVNEDDRTYERLPDRIKKHPDFGHFFAGLFAALGLTPP